MIAPCMAFVLRCSESSKNGKAPDCVCPQKVLFRLFQYNLSITPFYFFDNIYSERDKPPCLPCFLSSFSTNNSSATKKSPTTTAQQQYSLDDCRYKMYHRDWIFVKLSIIICIKNALKSGWLSYKNASIVFVPIAAFSPFFRPNNLQSKYLFLRIGATKSYQELFVFAHCKILSYLFYIKRTESLP